jgi:hypothetical protein
MALKWTAAGILEAEQQFRRVIGYRGLAKLAVAIEHDLPSLKLLLSPHVHRTSSILRVVAAHGRRFPTGGT